MQSSSSALKSLARLLLPRRHCDRCLSSPIPRRCLLLLFCTTTTIPPPSSSSPSLSSCEILLDSSLAEEPAPPPADAAEAFRRWGCTDDEAATLLDRRPFLRRMNLPSLEAKLQILGSLGIIGSNLVKVVICRPRLLAGRIGRDLQPRLDFLRSLFTSDADLLRAILRNPSLLNYDVDRTVRPCVRLYEEVGVGALDLGRLLFYRPTVIPRSSLDEEKLELLHRTPLSRESALYKYVVSIIAVSRLETLRVKIANLEKFGLSNDEVMAMFARNPNLLTLSVEKVQRNITYLMGTAKLPPEAVFRHPLLIFCNLDKVLRPRHMLGVKIEEMGLEPRIKEAASVYTAVKMDELRFLKVFVTCHPADVAGKLMEYYTSLKGLRRLAESSRSTRYRGFPF